MAQRVHVEDGASSTQCEGAASTSDWWEWERRGKAPLSGEGNGFVERLAEEPRPRSLVGVRARGWR